MLTCFSSQAAPPAEEYQVKKRDIEIKDLELDTSKSQGTFKIPILKHVSKFLTGEEK